VEAAGDENLDQTGTEGRLTTNLVLTALRFERNSFSRFTFNIEDRRRESNALLPKHKWSMNRNRYVVVYAFLETYPVVSSLPTRTTCASETSAKTPWTADAASMMAAVAEGPIVLRLLQLLED